MPKLRAFNKKVKEVPKAAVQSLQNLPIPGREDPSDAKLVQAIQNLPRITNETVAEHREEVLSSARKYIYPLSHSKRRVVLITVSLLITLLITFFAYCVISLYRLQATSTFMYGVTQVVPFPVAKAGSSWVSYESYLFELRHTMHYYQTQQSEDFTDKNGRRHLAQLKKQALQQVIDDAYVKQLAKQHHIGVSNTEVNNEIALLRSQNRLGSNDQVFRDVLSEFWGWTTEDFRRELRQQMLTQKVVAQLDTATNQRAQTALAQLQAGTDFVTLAKQISDNPSTKPNGGDYGFLIDASNRDVPPQVVDAIFKLQPGQITGVINAGNSLEIDKLLDMNGTKAHAAQIVFGFKPVTNFIGPLENKDKPHTYITITQPN